MNVFGENEIVTTVEYIRAKYDFCTKNRCQPAEYGFHFYRQKHSFSDRHFEDGRLPLPKVRITLAKAFFILS